jgi:trimethylamine--corrinoid protein Co-methyltransferase
MGANMKTKTDARFLPRRRLLTETQIDNLHQSTLCVLEETGVKVENEEAHALLKKAGATVDQTQIVKIPSHLVESALDTAPKTVTIYHRDLQNKMILEGFKTWFGTGSGCPFTYDLYTDELRRTQKKDTENFAVIGDYLENIDFIMSMGNCNDMPEDSCHRCEFEAMVTHTTKPICFTAEKLVDTKRIYQAAEVIAGGPDQLKAHPFCILYNEPQAPLCHPREAVNKLLFCAEEKLPIVYAAGVAAGATGPATLAGAIVQANAEELSGLVIHQLKAEGAPFVYGCTVTILDMGTANYTHGCPEQFLMNTARAELAHSYGLPIFGVGGRTDAKSVDAQAGIEFALSTLFEAFCGAGMIHDVGYLGTGIISSYEMLVMADELIGMIKRIMRGLEISPETLAEDVIKQVGPGGQYITHAHTLAHFKNEFWFPTLSSRDNVQSWQEKGCPELRQILKDKAISILKEHKTSPLSDEIFNKIHEILK